ncbi:hypothetical protein SLEP1_g31797 [Rubroshorea leprosula]|uniref:Ribosomal protein L20 n=1 Tax=Rubroshorea leprosula TaxID=152421 RepID=A0AAV5K4E8_9ROSI|nr:hypothetical protein SLEP1_g31797 [Rubroshorea leprosula]
MSQVSYKRVAGGKRSHGSGGRVFRLNSRRFSVQGLRTRFFCLFRLLSRLKASYGRAVRLLKNGVQRKNGMMMRRNNSSGSRRNLVVMKEAPVTRLRSFGRSNSFYAEAIADCLEFIKRSSFSVEQIQDPVCEK